MREHDEDQNGTVWAKIHEVDNRVSVLETKTEVSEKLISSIADRHISIMTTLERLSVLFEKFIDRFDAHVLQEEKAFNTQSSKLESATRFQTMVKSIWQTIVIVAIVLSTVAGAVYTVSEKAGVVVHLHKEN